MQKLSWSKLNRKLKGFYFSDVGRTLAELVYWRCNHSKKQWLKGNKFFKIWIVEHYLRYIQNPLKILPQLVPFLLLLKKKIQLPYRRKMNKKNGKWIRDIKFFVSSKMYNKQQSNSRSQSFMWPIPYWTKGVSF